MSSHLTWVGDCSGCGALIELHPGSLPLSAPAAPCPICRSEVTWTGSEAELLIGLCADRADHEPHRLEYAAVAAGPFWCHAEQDRRQPFAGELRQQDRWRAERAEAGR